MDDETKLTSFICGKRKTLQLMFRELRELDKENYAAILDVLSQYVEDTSPQFQLICNRTYKILESLKILQLKNREMFKHNWIQVSKRAKLKEAGICFRG
jgi:hypothetical protein